MVSDMLGKAAELLRGVAAGDPDLATRNVSPDAFVQHDPSLADGVAGLREQAGLSAANGKLTIVRALEDGPYVVMHGQSGTGGSEEIFFVVFRFENGLVVEHWRFTAPLASPNESEHTQIDGQTGPDASQDTGSAKALVREYYETVHVGGKHESIAHFMSGDRQLRHEPGVRDGVAAFKRDLAMLTASRTIDEIVLLLGQNDLVFVAARGTHEGEPCAYIDLYRVEGGKLVEHWGFPQAIPSREDSKNGNDLL